MVKEPPLRNPSSLKVSQQYWFSLQTYTAYQEDNGYQHICMFAFPIL